MDYFKLLNLTREPFSNAPDPELFYKTNQHNSCLQQLEIAIRLKRGLNVVIGEVGTGKTTLCRHLIRSLSQDPDIKCNLILDPGYKSPLNFLKALREQLCPREEDDREEDELALKEQIKSYLFDQVAISGKTDLLIIDEGQKIPHDCLEILRELLNFESNSEKLLQIIIFAQPEFKSTLNSMHNVTDRINLLYELQPLTFQDTQSLILHRIEKSKIEQKKSIKFTLPALWTIYRSTSGYPRKIINLCHKIILILVMQQKFKVTWFMVHKCNKELAKQGKIHPAAVRTGKRRPVYYYAFIGLAALLAAVFVLQGTKTVSLNTDFIKSLLPSREVTELGLVQDNANQSQKRISREITQNTQDPRPSGVRKKNLPGTAGVNKTRQDQPSKSETKVKQDKTA
ncbi:MAG: ExeA family protein, partial [Thermodesulfobacteriota bacterium]